MDSKISIENPKQAHLRFIEYQNQCHLSFDLEYQSEQFGEVNECIISVRQLTETVEALLQHTKNKVLRVLQNKLTDTKDKENKENENEETKKLNTFPLVDLNISLKNKNKAIKEDTMLKNLEKYKGLTFTILEKHYRVILNAPLIESIQLPEIIYSGHAVQPSVFKAILTDHSKCKYQWYKSEDKKKWTKIGQEYYYTVSESDINNYLKFKCFPNNSYEKGLPYEIISVNVVNKVPEVPYCPFEERHKNTPEHLSGNQFRIVSYNTLSCRYSNNQFHHCPVQYLAIDYRKQLLLKELVGYNADIICCQEVDNKIFSFYFRNEFKNLSYGSIYNKKGNRIPEGLAIFYNKKRFSFAGQGQIVFNSEVKTNNSLRNILKIINNDEKISEIFMKQATSMQYIYLKLRNSNELIILANTHLYYHPEANNVRLLQTAVCLEYLRHLHKQETKKNKRLNVSVIFCGDFNSTPTSDVYKFITTGSIQYNCEEVSKNCSTTLFHPFQFTSACGTPKFTNYTEDFKACLDYIFCNNLSVLSHVPFPSEEILSENVALPSPVFPSDHISLCADLKFNCSSL